MEQTSGDLTRLREMLTAIEFFSRLKIHEIEEVLGVVELRHFRRGEMLIKEGDPGDAFYIISRGRVGVFKSRLFFKSRVATRTPGEYIGEMALVEESTRMATVIADEDGEAFVIFRKSFTSILMKNPAIAGLIRETVNRRHAETRAAGF